MLCFNNLNDFGLKKGLDNLDAVRQTFKVITSRFAGFQAQWLNVHVDFPLLQRMALPITIGSVRYPVSKSTTDASSGSSRFCCMAVLTSAAGPRRKSTKPSAPPSVSPNHLMV